LFLVGRFRGAFFESSPLTGVTSIQYEEYALVLYIVCVRYVPCAWHTYIVLLVFRQRVVGSCEEGRPTTRRWYTRISKYPIEQSMSEQTISAVVLRRFPDDEFLPTRRFNGLTRDRKSDVFSGVYHRDIRCVVTINSLTVTSAETSS